MLEGDADIRHVQQMRDHEEVRPTDAIVPVPRSRAGYFIA